VRNSDRTQLGPPGASKARSDTIRGTFTQCLAHSAAELAPQFPQCGCPHGVSVQLVARMPGAQGEGEV
jgi:hypothetical protein